ncbi:helix-turn-helix transcriptional regulator [Pseudomonas sp. NPDC090203]|uniref:helix-turn-helix domain-containing protein n=1 Tax=Pseudomonas sp. NPDC090203 TaxID=3364477 RepID=UPI00381C2762
MEHTNPDISVQTHCYKGLTLREVEVLKWSAEGKTAAEVAIILDLKIRTVNFHIGSAKRKIGVTNKTSAVVHAALQGLF